MARYDVKKSELHAAFAQVAAVPQKSPHTHTHTLSFLSLLTLHSSHHAVIAFIVVELQTGAAQLWASPQQKNVCNEFFTPCNWQSAAATSEEAVFSTAEQLSSNAWMDEEAVARTRGGISSQYSALFHDGACALHTSTPYTLSRLLSCRVRHSHTAPSTSKWCCSFFTIFAPDCASEYANWSPPVLNLFPLSLMSTCFITMSVRACVYVCVRIRVRASEGSIPRM